MPKVIRALMIEPALKPESISPPNKGKGTGLVWLLMNIIRITEDISVLRLISEKIKTVQLWYGLPWKVMNVPLHIYFFSNQIILIKLTVSSESAIEKPDILHF